MKIFLPLTKSSQPKSKLQQNFIQKKSFKAQIKNKANLLTSSTKILKLVKTPNNPNPYPQPSKKK